MRYALTLFVVFMLCMFVVPTVLLNREPTTQTFEINGQTLVDALGDPITSPSYHGKSWVDKLNAIASYSDEIQPFPQFPLFPESPSVIDWLVGLPDYILQIGNYFIELSEWFVSDIYVVLKCAREFFTK